MQINIKLPDELHKALKVKAATMGVPLKQLIIQLLTTNI
jgi:predicted HicB family RNase H-like nuclease